MAFSSMADVGNQQSFYPCTTSLYIAQLPLTPPSTDDNFDHFDHKVATCASIELDRKPYRDQLVAVVGVGYVGYHLVEAFAKVYNVLAYDVSKKRLQQVYPDLRGRNIRCTSHAPDLAAADYFLISVPTTLNHDKSIDTSCLRSAVRMIGIYAKHGATVVVESSVAVGMTRALLLPLVATKNVKRVDPGRKLPKFEAIPKIISGLDTLSLKAIETLYTRVFDHLIPVSTLEVAEMTKLYENCQRMVCAAYANEMADACTSLGVNAWEVSRAAASKPFGYQPFQPGPGIGGHCIPVNPYYLFQTCHMPILRHATEASSQRPAIIAARLVQALEKKCCFQQSRQRRTPDRPRVLVVGVGFKKGQSVLSNSPGVEVLRALLSNHDVYVEYADPLVDQEMLSFVPRMNSSMDWTQDHLEGFDGILVAVDQVGLDMDMLGKLRGVVLHDYAPRVTVPAESR